MADVTRFSAVIFDFDGVIVDSETMQARAWTRVARELGQRDRSIAPEQIAGRLDTELAAELFPGADPAQCLSLKARFETEMEAAGELRLVDGAEQLVQRLAAGHRLAICSSCHPVTIARRLDRAGLSMFFPTVVGRRDGGSHKPAPDLYLRALDALRLEAADACAIEDSPTGIAAARAARIHAIQLLHPGMPRAAEADEHVTSLHHVKTRRAAIDRHAWG